MSEIPPTTIKQQATHREQLIRLCHVFTTVCERQLPGGEDKGDILWRREALMSLASGCLLQSLRPPVGEWCHSAHIKGLGPLLHSDRLFQKHAVLNLLLVSKYMTHLDERLLVHKSCFCCARTGNHQQQGEKSPSCPLILPFNGISGALCLTIY